MSVFEVTAPDGRVLEIEGDKAPSENELNNIFQSIPQSNSSKNQSALKSVKSVEDEPEIGLTLAEKFNKLRLDASQYASNIPQKEKGMSWIEYAKLRKKYDEDWNLHTQDLNPLKNMWKNSIIGGIGGTLYRDQKTQRASKYTDNKEVLTEIPAQAQADWMKKGEIKAGEAFMRSDWSKAIPLVGSGNSISESFDIKGIIDKKNCGDELSKKEIEKLNAYILDVAEQNYRGVSFGGKLIQGALELPSFAGEFMATGGIASIGKTAMQKTLTKGLQNATQKEIGKRLTKGLIEGGAGAVTRTTLGMPQRVAENYGMRKLHESLGITDKGQVVLETADNSPALTFLKAWGDTVIENWSEEMGAGLSEAAGLSFKGANKLLSPLEEKLFSRNTRAAFIKAMRKIRPNATVKDIMTRAGFNGILEEMGEERAGDVLRAVFGIDDREDVSTFEKLCEAVNPGAEELLLELGLFSIPGAMSFASSQVANHLRKQNVDEKDIENYIRLSSELEKEKFLHNIADNRDLSAAINFENSVNELKNRYFTQNLNAGIEKTEALATADIQANAISSLAKNIGMDINELNEEFNINLQSLTDEQAKAQFDTDTKVLQGGIEMNVNNQSIDKNNIEKSFGDSVENITENVKADINNILIESGVDKSEFNFEDIRIYGSYSTGKNKETSDLDFIVQYSGSMREDDAFNMLNDEKLTIEDVNGRIVEIDINPINVEKSGTIDENLKYFDSLQKSEDNIYFQSAMYKSPKKTFKEFYNQVFEKENEAKQDNRKIKKSFYDYTDNDISVRIPHDTIVHDNNKHNLSSEQWEDVLKNLSNPTDAVLSNRARYNGQPVLLKVNTDNNSYGVVIEIFENKQPLVTTAFIDSEKNIDKWLNEKRSAQARNTSAVTTKGMLLSQDLNNIITNVKQNLKSNVNNHEAYFQNSDNIDNARGFTYQRYNFDGTVKDNLIVLLKNKADKSTLLHEFAHVYLTTLNNLALKNDRAKELLLTVNKWLRYNGKEYTTAQHEKFANGFVAYIKSGKAPTYGLKRAFENFRKWLNDLYSSISVSEEFELDDDARDVFNELLGDKSIDAQKQISQEIIKKARDNALLKIQEELTSKEKISPNLLTERQRRYRDTAYEILWYALVHSKDNDKKPLIKNMSQLKMLLGNAHAINSKNKGIIKQAEKLELFLAELDDAFSGNDGFQLNWGEFFHDTGVSYNNMEVGGDAELALQALDVIKNKKYLYNTENPLDEITDYDIKKAEFELEYIIENYRNSIDKTNSVVAFFDWIDMLHPYIQEDFINKWENQTNEIDRYQNLSKFQQAKEDLKIYAATLKGYGDYSSQFAEFTRKILKRLDFMTEHDKAKIFDKLKEYNSFREIERNLDDVMDYAETLTDVSERKAIADNIVREVKQTIHTWQNGIKKTKYTYPANKLFSRLREIENMKQADIQDLYDMQVNEEALPSYVADEVNSEDYYNAIEKMYITFKANGNYYNSTEFLTDLLNRIQSAKFTAKVARDEIDFERRMQQINLVDECGCVLDERKDEIARNDKIKTIGTLNAAGANLNGFFKMLFNDSIKNQFSLDYLYAKKDGQVGKDRRTFLDKAKEIWGYKGKTSDIQLFNRFINMTKKEFTIAQRYTPDIETGTYRLTVQNKESGKNYTEQTIQLRKEGEDFSQWKPEIIELSKMEVLYYYIQAKNPTSYSMLTDEDKGQFNKQDFENLINNLTEQEKLLGDIMQLSAEKYWNALNAYHIKKYHTELGKVKGYFPRLSDTQEVKVLEMFNDFVQPTSNGKFQKQRTAGPGVRIKPANALAVLFDHIEKANTVTIMGEQLDLMNRVFKDPNLKNKIEAVWGEKITKEFYNQITGNLFTGQAVLTSMSENFAGKLMNNAIKSAIFFKPQIGIKQIISFMNYGKGDEYVSAGEWTKAFAKQTFTPAEWKKNIEFMFENDYLRDRFSRGGSTDALKRELESRVFSKTNLLDEFFGLPVAVGDISAIILGGKPYIDVLMNKGYTKEQAFKIFIETTVNDQQSSIPSTLSNMQRNASKSPLTKMFFAFQNTPWQYYRQCTNAVMKAVQSNSYSDKIKAGKMLFVYGWLFPAIFNMVSSLSPLIFANGGGDDELLNDFNPLTTFSSLVTQHPIVGELIKAVLDAGEGNTFNSNDLFSRYFKSVNKLIRDIQKSKVTLKDVWNATVAFAEPVSGIPLGSIGNALSGVYDITQGDIEKGLLKVVGYSDYRAKQVTGKE